MVSPKQPPTQDWPQPRNYQVLPNLSTPIRSDLFCPILLPSTLQTTLSNRQKGSPWSNRRPLVDTEPTIVITNPFDFYRPLSVNPTNFIRGTI